MNSMSILPDYTIFFQYTIAIMGYGPEDNNAVLELTYHYGVKEYDKGNGYAQVTPKFSMRPLVPTWVEE